MPGLKVPFHPVRRVLSGVLLLVASFGAYSQAFTKRSAFTAALPGTASTVNFDAVAAGTKFASGTGTGGLTFSYNYGGVTLKVSSAYPAPSLPHSLGSTDADILQDGDNLTLNFSQRNAIGLSIITIETLQAGDLSLTAGGTTAALFPSVQQTLSDGAKVYFLGVIEPTVAFSTATLSTVGGGFFFYNIDDVTTATAPDADRDGIANSADNCTLVGNPSQLDADGDGYGNLCDADLNNSGIVTAADFAILRSVLNKPATSSPTAAAADLNGSGTVTTADFAILRAALNLPPGPSGLHP